MTKVQHLRITDLQCRLNFIAWLVVTYESNPEILQNILWTDECKFSNNSIISRHNHHFWSKDNLHWFREHNFQQKVTMNIWCGLVYGHLIGPYFYEQNLTVQAYLNFLRSQLPTLLQVLLNDIAQRIYFQQDDCPSHNARIIV